MKKIIILILLIAVACRNSQQNNKADAPLEEQVPLNEDIISEEIPQENTPEINLDYKAFIENKNDILQKIQIQYHTLKININLNIL